MANFIQTDQLTYSIILGKAQAKCVVVNDDDEDDLSINEIEKVFGLPVDYTAIDYESLESIKQNCQNYSEISFESLKNMVRKKPNSIEQCLRFDERLKRIAQGFSIQAFVALLTFLKE